MSLTTIHTTGSNRSRRVGLVVAALAALVLVGAVVRQAFIPATAPGPTSAPAPIAAMAPTATTVSAPVRKAGAPAPAKPTWAELTPAQQKALAPLASEWDELGPARKKKWLAIGNKFGSMSAAEQQRVHKRMGEWMQLTPQQRLVARDSYSRAKKLEPKQKSARWEQYQNLPEEQKEKLANTTVQKRVATLPPASSKGKTVAPIKSTPKPALELALTPQPGSYPAVQSPPNPAPVPAAAVVPPAEAPRPPPEAAPAPIQPAPLDPTQF